MLAIDLGATSGRGIIGTFDGEKLRLEENHRFDDNSSYIAGTLQWNIMDIYENIKTAVKLAGKDCGDVEIPFDYREGRVYFAIDGLVMFDMFMIEF